MESINFKNGIRIQSKTAYNLYHMYFEDFSELIIALPNKDFNQYKLLLYFTDKKYKSENIDTDELVAQNLSDKLDKIYATSANAICIVPTILKKEFDEVIAENDDRLYKRLIKNLDKVVNYAYWSIKNNLIFEDTMNVDEHVYIVKQDDEDIKLFWWLELQGNKKYKQITLEETKVKETPVETPPVVKEEAPTVEFLQEEPTVTKGPPPRRQTMRKTRSKPSGDGVHSTGYSNMAFIILVLTISMLMGIGLAVLILK